MSVLPGRNTHIRARCPVEDPVRRLRDPNKTWAGLLGGIFSSLMVAWIFYLFWLESDNPRLFIMAIIIAIISQVGDLLESAYKRSYKIKDSSRLIPGHGGVLDRLDGHMAAGIFMSCILLYYDRALI